jgi:hypothetical protein
VQGRDLMRPETLLILPILFILSNCSCNSQQQTGFKQIGQIDCRITSAPAHRASRHEEMIRLLSVQSVVILSAVGCRRATS